MTDTNGNINGHTASLSDVFGRVGKLETSVTELETGMVALQNDMHRIESGQGQIINELSKLSEKQGNSGRTNWSVVIGAGGLAIAIITAIGSGFILPLKLADTYHERQLELLESTARQNRERLVSIEQSAHTVQMLQALERGQADRISRMEEREKLYRETGMIGAKRGH